MNRLQTIHLGIGTLGLIAFLLTGQYMQWVHNGLQEMPDGPRLFFRSTHIFLLWSSLLNVVLGCYLVHFSKQFLRHVQSAASLAILVGPVLLCISFFVETHNPALLRPMGQLAIFLAFGGVLAHVCTFLIYRTRNKET